MPRGYEWLVGWYTANSVWKRAVALVVKLGIEGGTVAIATAPVAVLFWMLANVDSAPQLGGQTILGIWGTAAVLVFNQAYCFSTAERERSLTESGVDQADGTDRTR